MAVLITIFAVVVVLLGVLVAGLLRSHAEILRGLHELGIDLDPARDPATPTLAPGRSTAVAGPRVRSDAPAASDLAGVTPTGDAVSVAVVGARQPTLLAFLTSGCATCVGFWSAFSAPDRLRVPGGARLVVVTKGEEAESPGRLRKFASRDLLVVMSSEAWTAYDVPVAPYFAYVDGRSGEIVGEGAAASWDQLASMMDQALADAGFEPSGGDGPARGASSARSRARRIDRELLGAGIEPGNPSLYPTSADDLHQPGPPR